MNQEAERAERSLYLVQHGEAKAKSEDPQRSLTEAGCKSVERVAAWAARQGITVDQIFHSGKLRAEQTAEIFGEQLEPPDGITFRAGLQPNDDPADIAAALTSLPGSVMIVGHLPFLSRLVGKLVADDPDRSPVRFCDGGLVGLVTGDKWWAITCVVPPELT